MATKYLCHIHKCKKLYQTLNHEIAHHNGQGETSATRMGKLGNVAYNIGTSLNKEDIDNHRQGITPTAQTLQGLSTDERLACHTQNQALLDENKEQLEGEKESDGVWGYEGDYRGKSNAQLAKETREFMSNEEASIVKDLIGVTVAPVGFLDAYHNAKTDEEKALAITTAFKIPISRAKIYVQQAKRKKVEANYEAVGQAKKASTKADKPTTTQTKATCTTGNSCFTAGTFIETSEGLKAIETFTGGELIWTRNDITLEYGYRPVIATKATPDQAIFQVTVKNHQGDIETLETTAEHPFWIKDTGWLKASLLEQGMILLDRNNQEVEVLSQYLIPNRLDTVYNIEVDDFHTYHVGRLGVWVHNDNCCDLNIGKNRTDYSSMSHKNITERKGNGDIVNQSPSRQALGNDTIEPFNLRGSDAYKQLKTDKERKEFISHYTRQLKRQEEAINSLSPDELLSAIDAYKTSGRESPKAQGAFTRQFKRKLRTDIENSIRGKPQYQNLSQAEIKKYAKDRTEEIASKLAALHDPDQVVGGSFSQIKHMGSRSANGSIGGGWANGKRVSQLKEAAEKLKKSGATKMNISFTIK